MIENKGILKSSNVLARPKSRRVPRYASYYQTNRGRFLEGLSDLLRIPSVSTLPEHKKDVRRAAEFLLNGLRSMGMARARLIESRAGQNPLVYAEWLGAPGKPTILFYGHYDVQPPDPLGEWQSSPFEPSIRDGNIYARGASDDKGQTYILLKAVEGWLKGEGRLPINVKFLIEGEEEVGGEHIEAFVPKNKRLLRADACVICDTEMFAPGLPTLTTGLRGLVGAEVEAHGAAHDLHSGLYGGAAPNPLQALAEIISSLKDRDGKIRISGFYRRVKRPDAKELAAWKRLPFSEKQFLKREVGSTALAGERGYGVLERLWARPTLEVNGIYGGFTGEGFKTVIPAAATAKISMRLVPGMDPKEVVRQFTAAVKKLAPPGIQTRVRVFGASPASVVSTKNRYVKAAAQAMEEVFKKKAVFMRSGGSIPIAGLFGKHLHAPVVMMGFGLPDDNLHAPNEKFHLANFYHGIEAVGRYLELLGTDEC
ncbi:MAG TPA: dipeptidase [Terriglobia bacterium]|nr:dipeptidase [Terriglobia bacterium]